MPKPFLVIQHIESEDAGVFAECLARQQADLRTVKPYAGDPVPVSARDFSGVLVMGGPMNVDQAARYPFLSREMDLIRDCREQGVPLLGICLGSQLIAASFGARVYDGPVREIGWYEVWLEPAADSDPLFQGFPERFTVFQWHGQTFDLPSGAVLLCGSESFPHQAFRLDDRLWGIQFHLEITGGHVRTWLKDNSAEMASLPYIDREAVLAGIEAYENACRRLAVRLFERFFALTRQS